MLVCVAVFPSPLLNQRDTRTLTRRSTTTQVLQIIHILFLGLLYASEYINTSFLYYYSN
jgi:hypothetical protein